MVLIDLKGKQYINSDNLYYKCKWSPFEGHEFNSRIRCTFVNGNLVYCNGAFNKEFKGERLTFNRWWNYLFLF